MRFLSLIITILILIIVIVFALHNKGLAEISFWPFDLMISIPISFLTLGMLFVGFALGSGLPVITIVKLRIQKRMLKRKIDKLTSEREQK